MRHSTIGEICNIKTGKLDANASSPNGQYPFFTCSREVLRIDHYAYDAECVLIAGNGELNVKYYNGKFNAYQRTYIITLKPTVQDISVKYLYTFFTKYIETLRKDSIGGVIKYIKLGNLTDAVIPVPPIAEQEKIVAELDCLTGIVEKKKQQLEELDKLAQSIFYDMFGDPITNEKGFPVQTIDDVIAFQGGSQPAKSFFQYEATEDNIRLIQTRDYRTDGYITYIPKSLARRFCNKDDIMIGRYGPPIFQIFKGLEGAYNVALMKAIPKKGNREFIRAFLQQKCLLHYLENFSQRVAGQDGIQMDKLKSYPFPYPPTDLQDLFVQKVEAIDRQKKLVKRSIVETETLFNSRMDYWFN